MQGMAVAFAVWGWTKRGLVCAPGTLMHPLGRRAEAHSRAVACQDVDLLEGAHARLRNLCLWRCYRAGVHPVRCRIGRAAFPRFGPSIGKKTIYRMQIRVAFMVRVVAWSTFSGIENIAGHDASHAASIFILMLGY